MVRARHGRITGGVSGDRRVDRAPVAAAARGEREPNGGEAHQK
jgi:hypothetical protein